MRRLAIALLPPAVCSAAARSADDGGGSSPQPGARRGHDEQGGGELGFPSAATRNTVRVAGADAAADAAGVASALFPATGQRRPPDRGRAGRLASDWQSRDRRRRCWPGRRSARRCCSRRRRPAGGDARTRSTASQPKGSDLSKDAQVIRIGDDVARPEGFKTAVVQGDDAYERAAAVDRFFSAARGRAVGRRGALLGRRAPSGRCPPPRGRRAPATPRCRSSATRSRADPARAAPSHERPNVYLLGPRERDLARGRAPAAQGQARGLGQPHRRAAPRWRTRSRSPATRRATSAGASSCPATTSRRQRSTGPLDAAAAASLATRGVFAPLLLTDDAAELPQPLETYLLSVQPGYEDDPGQAVYNRAWILGDDKAISVRRAGAHRRDRPS